MNKSYVGYTNSHIGDMLQKFYIIWLLYTSIEIIPKLFIEI